MTHLPATPSDGAEPTTIQIQQSGNTRTAEMTLPVSQAHAWNVLTNYVATGEAMPDVSKVQLLSRQGNLIRMRQTYQAPYTFGLTINATLSVKESPKTAINFHMLKGDRIRKLNGSWTITPTTTGTRLRHTITLVPELPGMLQPVFAELTRNSLRESMQRLSELMQANN
ncbi:Polyketide cyclase / dehydrase and lipid transport [Synechococcus sp. MIT S9508]|nr:Polyketide cyclase / dehydrase and lipid transport [Synechococcus sp. MIT S9508]